MVNFPLENLALKNIKEFETEGRRLSTTEKHQVGFFVMGLDSEFSFQAEMVPHYELDLLRFQK